ncbi:50S ribosomal protein L10 [Candidatus Pacearchaeota archaeon]|nr:50S ribosomal protein L10 [Candidatus Pacearchaeota archaeon]
MEKKKSASVRIKPVPEEKIRSVEEFSSKMKKSKTILIASTKGLPSSQFQKIKKDLRGKAEISVAKKSIIDRAIKATGKGALQELAHDFKDNSCLMFSDMDAFELSALLVESESATKAKAGDIAPEDINIDEGPTDLVPGPAISELSGVGLKVAVEGGKLAIKKGAVVAKKGEPIKENVAGVLSKLKIDPMKVGFVPVAAYDAINDKVYRNIKIDKKALIEELRQAIGKSFWFAVNLCYIAKETIGQLIAKAGREEMTIENILNKTRGKNE